MPDPPPDPPAPPPAGPFFSTWGPLDGPILGWHHMPAIGVVDEPGGAWPIGAAYPGGLIAHRRGPAQTFRLVIGKAELEGRWLCVGRRFIPLGEVAEEV